MSHRWNESGRPYITALRRSGGPCPAAAARQGGRRTTPHPSPFATMTIVLSIGVAVVLGPTLARADTLSPEQVQTLRIKFRAARTTAASLDARAKCLQVFQSDLQREGGALDVLIGDQTREIDHLQAEVGQIEEHVRQLHRTIDEENERRSAKEREQEERRHALQDKVNYCNKWHRIWPWCWSPELASVEIAAQMEELRSRDAFVTVPVLNFRELTEAEMQLGGVKSLLQAVQEHRSSSMDKKRRTEDRMVFVQDVLNTVTSLKFRSMDVVDDMLHRADEGDGIVSSEPEYVETLLGLANEVDAFTSRAPALIRTAEEILPETTRQACSLGSP